MNDVRHGKHKYIVTGTAVVRFKIETFDDSPKDARDTIGCIDASWLEGNITAVEEVQIEKVAKSK